MRLESEKGWGRGDEGTLHDIQLRLLVNSGMSPLAGVMFGVCSCFRSCASVTLGKWNIFPLLPTFYIEGCRGSLTPESYHKPFCVSAASTAGLVCGVLPPSFDSEPSRLDDNPSPLGQSEQR